MAPTTPSNSGDIFSALSIDNSDIFTIDEEGGGGGGASRLVGGGGGGVSGGLVIGASKRWR